MKHRTRKRFRIAANCFLILLFFSVELKDLPWQVWFLAFAIACILNKASSFICAWRENWSWEGETNWWVQRAGKEMGFGFAMWLHTLGVIASGLLFGEVVSIISEYAVALVFFLGSIYMAEASLHNIVLSFMDYETKPIFSPEPC